MPTFTVVMLAVVPLWSDHSGSLLLIGRQKHASEVSEDARIALVVDNNTMMMPHRIVPGSHDTQVRPG